MSRVSVVMPIYNSERYLLKAIRSIQWQTFGEFELLLLDDGSNDGSPEIAKACANQDSRIVFVAGNHRGVVAGRNAGVDLAKNDLVAMMDSDDVSLPTRLSSQLQYMEAHPECCAVGTQAMRIDEDGFPIEEWRVPESHLEIDRHHMTDGGGAIINPSVMMRKRAVVKVGGYRSGYDSSEDYDLFLRLAEVGSLANLPEIMLQYRLHAKSLTFSRAVFQQQMGWKALEEACLRRGIAQVPAPPANISAPSEEELRWTWAHHAFAARNFAAARNQAFKLWRQRPFDRRRSLLFAGTCLGPVAVFLKKLLRYRIGGFQSESPRRVPE